jgi:hypothetical protein
MKMLEKTKSRDPSGLWVSLPMVVSFGDYHEIESLADLLNNIRDADRGGFNKVKCEEIGFKDGQYLGLFYYLKRDPAYKRLKKEHGQE